MNLLRRLHDPALSYVRLDVRREVTHGLVGLMEAMWIAPWFAVLIPGAREIPPHILLAFVSVNVLWATMLVRALDARGMWENLRQLLFLLSLGIATLWAAGVVMPIPEQAPIVREISEHVAPVKQLVVPPIVAIMVLVGVVWWRGLRLAITSPTPTRVSFGMRLGILFYFGAALLTQSQQVALASLPPFFFFGLLATSLARAISLRETGGQTTSFGSRWSVFMVLAAGGITLIGFLIAALLGGLDPDLLATIIQPLFTGVVLFFALLMSPILLLAGKLVELLIEALTSGGMLEELETPVLDEPLVFGDQPQGSGLQEMVNRFQEFLDKLGGFEVCISVLVLLVIVAVIVLTIRRQQRASIGENEERENLDGDALAGLRDMFRRGLGALNNALNTVSQFGFGRDLFAALTIRRAYAQMVRLGTERGYPRGIAETPYEYAIVLQVAFQHVQMEIDLITQAYVRVHYGEVPENQQALDNVVSALERLKQPAPE